MLKLVEKENILNFTLTALVYLNLWHKIPYLGPTFSVSDLVLVLDVHIHLGLSRHCPHQSTTIGSCNFLWWRNDDRTFYHRSRVQKKIITTVVPANSESDVMFCLQRYQQLILVY